MNLLPKAVADSPEGTECSFVFPSGIFSYKNKFNKHPIPTDWIKLKTTQSLEEIIPGCILFVRASLLGDPPYGNKLSFPFKHLW